MVLCFSQANGADNPLNNFSITTSPLNQRIEAYWCKMRLDRSFFQDMVDMGLYNPSDQVQVECLRYCFTNTIRKELSTVANEWNQHIISKSMNGEPSGRPGTMFFLPHLYNAENHLENIDLEEVELIYPEVIYTPKDFPDDFKEFAEFNLEGFNIDNEFIDAAAGLDLF